MQELISSNYSKLSPQLQRAARFVAEHPEEVATRSLRQIAASIDLSPPTFSRLAGALGFENYEALRESCRRHIKNQGLRFADKAGALREQGSGDGKKGLFILKQGAAAIENIEQLLNSVDPDRLELAAAQLLAARKVILVGMMSSQPFVDYMAYMASMGFENWNVLGRDPGSAASLIANLNANDVALVISKHPYAARAVHAAEQIHNQGATVIGITDSISAPLCAYCDIPFFVSTETPQFFTSHAATLVLLESLIGLVVANSSEDVEARIAIVEAKSYEMGDYFPTP